MGHLFEHPRFGDTSALNGFAGNRLDRLSEARTEASLAEALADPAARLYLLAEERALVAAGSAASALHDVASAAALGLDRGSLVLLGTCPGGPRLAGSVPSDRPLPDGMHAIDLRSLASQALLPAEELGALAQARSLLSWHENHRFCARCGAPTVPAAGGVRRECGSCGAQHFPRVDPVAIMLAIDGDRCLLGRQARFPPGRYSALAGFIEPGETIEGAVRREVGEESGILVGRVAYHSSQPWPFPSSLMLGCFAEALSTEIRRDESELEDCRWFTRAEVRAILAGTHPDGFTAPPAIAIARSLVAAFAASEAAA
ncbi:NAD(+) diphosphatase [Propylenella binzhouense]|uniref:NAD(+) diphosphatase n=1 Tax=Propylenella binzhouense TaxID=2555902 RepID=A0A964WUH2_9HYPH|nr:NAD(+) diphosphatase [Propylenella binzhouense]